MWQRSRFPIKSMRKTMHKALGAASPIGTEHEYSINDKNHRPLAISDRIIQRIAGQVQHEVPFGGNTGLQGAAKACH